MSWEFSVFEKKTQGRIHKIKKLLNLDMYSGRNQGAK